MNRLVQLLGCILAFTGFAQAAELTLAGIFTDNTVLQRDAPVPIWGRANSGDKIEVHFGNTKKSATAGDNGRWQVVLDSMPANAEPQTLSIRGKKSIEIKNVLVGDVWLCSGQSNMAMIVDRAKDPEKEKAAADFPGIRVFTVGRNPSLKPLSDCTGEWVISTPETAGKFSATAFFFGREIHREQDVPVGLIVTAWSGSAIEAWTSLEVQEKESALTALLQSWEEKDLAYTPEIEAAKKADYESKFAEWKTASKKAKAVGEGRPKAPRRPVNPRNHWHHPTVLFNGMIAPLIPYRIKGALWYQGETNGFTRESGELYGLQLPMMIKDWRKRWGHGDFPMAWVQLPFTSASSLAWPSIRESMRTATSLPNTGMAVTIDIGEERLLHPLNKQGFAHRLALWARAEVYGEDINWSGPQFAKSRTEGAKLVLSFTHTDGGLQAKEGELRGFEIAAADGNFLPATATLQKNTVTLSHPGIKEPIVAAYSWANHPDGNLTNGSGLPASPFRTANLTPSPEVSINAEPVPFEPGDISKMPKGLEQLDIVLLMGQSNMKGRGKMPAEPLQNPQIVMLHKKTDEWFLARHPLHHVGDPHTMTGADNAGVGAGLAFAQAHLEKHPKSRVALIPCAAGGTRISKWQRGQRLYEEAVRRAKLALGQGPEGKTRIVGALWLQGEADSADQNRIDAYPGLLSAMITDLRTDLDIPDLPFVACTIGELRDSIERRKKINGILLSLPELVPDTACVDGRDQKGTIGDNVHFDTAAQEEFGRRFSRKLDGLTGSNR